MTTIKILLITAAMLSLSACRDANKMANLESGGGGKELDMIMADQSPSEKKSESGKPSDKLIERKLIKNGEISFETKSITDTKAFLQKTIAGYKGYISNERIESYKTNPTEVLTIRVPGSDFDAFISKIEQQVGEFDSKKIDIDDVTAEFVDIEARLKNKKQLEEKYQELLKKAGNMEDILKIEAEISSIREDIESTEGRLHYLSSQVGYSTLMVTYYEEKPASGFKFGEKISDAFSNGGTGLLWFMIVMVQLWPLWVIGFAIWYLIRKIISRKKRKTLVEKADL